MVSATRYLDPLKGVPVLGMLEQSFGQIDYLDPGGGFYRLNEEGFSVS